MRDPPLNGNQCVLGVRGDKVNGTVGFALVEILVAMAVLGIVVLMIGAILDTATRTWREGEAKVLNYTKARAALGLIARDLQSMVCRQDLPGLLHEATGDSYAFLSHGHGQRDHGSAGLRQSSRRFALVNYRMAPLTDASLPLNQRGLRRGTWGYDFTAGSTGPGVSPHFGWNQSLLDRERLDSAPGLLQTIGPGVLFFEMLFVRRDGTLVDWTGYQEGQVGQLADEDAVGAVVTLAVLDEQTLTVLDRVGQLGELMNRIDSARAERNGGNTYDKTHLMALSGRITSGEMMRDLPWPVKGGVRVFERTVPLP